MGRYAWARGAHYKAAAHLRQREFSIERSNCARRKWASPFVQGRGLKYKTQRREPPLYFNVSTNIHQYFEI